MNWYVGQKVVCVNRAPFHPLVVGQVYAVTAVFNDPCGCAVLSVGIPYYELPAGYARHGSICSCPGCGGKYVYRSRPEATFLASRFRPVDALTEQIERIEKEGAPVELELELIEA